MEGDSETEAVLLRLLLLLERGESVGVSCCSHGRGARVRDLRALSISFLDDSRRGSIPAPQNSSFFLIAAVSLIIAVSSGLRLGTLWSWKQH